MTFAVSEPVRILVVGGSYGGLGAALNLLDITRGKHARFSGKVGNDLEAGLEKRVDVKVKIVDERDGYFHLIGSPLAFTSATHAEKFWIKYDDIPALRDPAVSVTRGSVSKVDPVTKTATILDTITNKQYEEKYDYLVAASGLRREKQVVPQKFTKEEYLVEAKKQVAAVGVGEGVKNGKGVVVIGGGAVGIEMASEIAVVHPSQRVTLIHSHDRLLSNEPLPAEVADLAASALREQGIELLLGERVLSSVEEGEGKYKLRLSNGTERTAGFVIWAISKQIPSAAYLPEDVLDGESGLVGIKSTLHFKTPGPFATHHFAVGDLVSWTGIKRCGAAMWMGYIAAHNIHQEILLQRGVNKDASYLTYPEVPPMIAVACGKIAVSYGVEEGAHSGEDIMETYFNDDLGFTICYDYLQLGTLPSEIEKGNSEIDTVALEEEFKDISIKEKIVVEAVGVAA